MAGASTKGVHEPRRKAVTKRQPRRTRATTKQQGRAAGHDGCAHPSGIASCSSPEIRVEWKLVDANLASVEQAARDVAETVLGHMQRKSARAEDNAGRMFTVRPERQDAWATKQSVEPLGYQEASERLAGIQWQAVDGGTLLVVTESGRVLEKKESVRERRRRMLAGVEEETPLRRRPLRVNIRPGQGGLKRQPSRGDFDPEEDLDAYGQLNWRSVGDGASVGVLELDPKGNGAIFGRLSGDDKGEKFVDQLRPCLALAKQSGEVVRPRVAVFAKNMTGTEQREVRHHRAGAPPPGVLERDDILLMDEYIAAGWLEHVLWRDPTRIARHTLPGEMIFSTLQREDIGLWIAWYGKQINWGEDGDRLRNDMVFSKRDRDMTVRKLHTAHANKGPLAGNGHLGPTPLGVIREKHTRRRVEDPVQMKWINRAFELADSGLYKDRSGLSVRGVRTALEEEGFPLSDERLRRLLRDTMYATGENKSRLRGIEIEQEPIQFDNPVPLDRFYRVQELFEMRKGRDDNTPLGEFLFNHVETLHVQCMHERNSRNSPPLIKGRIVKRKGKDSGARRLRHSYFVPEQCKGCGRGPNGAFSWAREELEPAVVAEVRKLATHPELLRQLTAAARHTLADADVRLSEAECAELEREIAQLQLEKESATEQWVLGVANGQKLQPHEKGFDNFQKFIDGYDRQIDQKRRRLERDAAAASAQSRIADPRHEERVNAFLEIMSVETPDDPLMKRLRGRLFQRVVSRILIDDDGEGPITLTIEGHLVPEGSTLDEGSPLLATADLLDSYVDEKEGRMSSAEAIVEKARAAQTAHSALAEWGVSTLYGEFESLPPTRTVDAARRLSLWADGWRLRAGGRRRTGVAAWRVDLIVHLSCADATAVDRRALIPLERPE